MHVLYGAKNGLASDLQTWTQNTPGVLGTAEHYESFGESLVADNFAGTAYDDLAIGVTGEGSTDEGDMPGAVQVLYGSVDGLTARGNQLWSQATPGLRTPPYTTFAFGSTLAAGHFAGRKYADLAIGSPDTQVLKDPDPGWSGDDEAGTVNVLYGSADGLSIAGNQLWTQHGRRIKGRVGPDEFGETLVAANFGKDPGRSSYDDLAIGAPLNGPLQEYRGAVHVLFGSPQGLTSVGDQRWDQRNPGIPGVREWIDGFGSSLAAADFGRAVAGRRYADLAVASPGETLRGISNAGRVHVLYGTADGLNAAGVQLWTEENLGATLRDHSAYEDSLGWLLIAADG